MGTQQTHQQMYVLELEGKPAGRFFDFSGGGMVADVVRESGTVGSFQKKHIGQVHFQDMVLSCGAGMSRVFYDWLADGVSGKPTRKNGAIIAVNYANKPVGRLDFKSALVKSVVLPKLDAKSNSNAVMTVTMSPELARSADAGGSPSLGVYVSSAPKLWKESAFKLSISGLEKDCVHVTQIESITINENVVADAVGSTNISQLVPNGPDYSNLVFTLPDTYSKGFQDWADDFLIKGNSRSSNSKTGSLEMLSSNLSSTYFKISFDGLGISALQMNKGGIAGKTGLPVTVALFCSGMTFSASAAAVM